ncbi:GNAT family N-acetyltransferase [Colwellia sp. 75C3]|uniref:GNAT family N-acetyltransferase n=1 Tax=Colwellia sp. 75C3 TaxID=888425 RepID=UPI000C33E1AD|nr:GNAT family N-acetyltransferase [Colwellia sp. 75C3]PKG85603.1 GNAT family N-acetyltransferase [Colwellia sp. 75C3]
MIVHQSVRLIVRQFELTDTSFIIDLLNDEAFIKNIVDKQVRTEDDARDYLINGPMMSYENFGFGLYILELKDCNTPIGMCGLLKRDNLEYADLGFSLLPQFYRQGYAKEASLAVLNEARDNYRLAKVSAVTALGNIGSNYLLKSLGFSFKKRIEFYQKEANYYEISLA